MRIYGDDERYDEKTTIGELEEYLTTFLPAGGEVKIVNKNGNAASDSTPIDHFFRDSWGHEISGAKKFHKKINSSKTVKQTIANMANKMNIPKDSIRICVNNADVPGHTKIGNI